MDSLSDLRPRLIDLAEGHAAHVRLAEAIEDHWQQEADLAEAKPQGSA